MEIVQWLHLTIETLKNNCSRFLYEVINSLNYE